MRFIQLDLNDFLLTRDSGITKLSVTFTELVQLIIGTNGSGKSSVMRQLSPYPAARSLFDKTGFKSQIIEHDGIYYRLESEYSKPSSPHAFYEGDSEENLNVGRTTETQKELIAEHLGITPLIDDLIMNRFVFPKWTAAKRKEFLMAHNPSDIGFVLQHTRQVSSKIRACKNNIARLQSRKILLEQDLLSEDDMQGMIAERERIDTDLGFFQVQLMNLEVGSRVLGDTSTLIKDLEVNTIKKTLRNARYRMGEFVNVSRDDNERHRTLQSHLGQLATYTHRLETIDTLIQAQTQELNEMEVQYRDIAPDGDLHAIENSIARLELERDKLKITKPEHDISREHLAQLYNTWESLRDQLGIFETCPIPLYSTRKRSLRERALGQAKYKNSSFEMTLSDLETQYSELTKRHSMSPADIPDAPCAKNACPLYSHFMEGYETTEAKRQLVGTQIKRYQRRYRRNQIFIEAMTRYFENSRIFHDRISQLIDNARSNPVLHSVLRGLDVLSTLRTSPNKISQRLKDSYDHIDQWLKYKDVITDLETAYALKSRCMGSQSHDTVKLVVGIENLKKSLEALRAEGELIASQRKETSASVSNIQVYEAIKRDVLAIQSQYQHYIQVLADRHESDRLNFLKKTIENIRSQSFVRMSEVERTLRAQSGLRERYQEEVVSELNRIEKEMQDLLLIEKALIEIPKEITIEFLNGIFEQANLIIGSIWTVPFAIELIKPDDDLNYEFMVSGDNQSLREMSECSEGQTEILSLAINLALRIHLGHLNFPLCLDETGRTFDDKHKQHLVALLKKLLDDKIVSQIFYVSHHATTHESFASSETLVIREDNVLLPEKYNLHATLI